MDRSPKEWYVYGWNASSGWVELHHELRTDYIGEYVSGNTDTGGTDFTIDANKQTDYYDTFAIVFTQSFGFNKLLVAELQFFTLLTDINFKFNELENFEFNIDEYSNSQYIINGDSFNDGKSCTRATLYIPTDDSNGMSIRLHRENESNELSGLSGASVSISNHNLSFNYSNIDNSPLNALGANFGSISSIHEGTMAIDFATYDNITNSYIVGSLLEEPRGVGDEFVDTYLCRINENGAYIPYSGKIVNTGLNPDYIASASASNGEVTHSEPTISMNSDDEYESGYSCEASSVYPENEYTYNAFHCFDGIDTTTTNKWVCGTGRYTATSGIYTTSNPSNLGDNTTGGQTDNGEYVILNMPLAVQCAAVKLHRFSADGSTMSDAPRDWKIYGRETLTGEWDEIYAITEQTTYSETGNTYYLPTVTKAYVSLSLVVIRTNGGTTTALSELEFIGNYPSIPRYITQNELSNIYNNKQLRGSCVLNWPSEANEYPEIALTSDDSYGYVTTASSTHAGRAPWHAFNKNRVGQDYWMCTPTGLYSSGVYQGSSSLGDVSGEWISLELPYYIKLTSVHITARDIEDDGTNVWDNRENAPKDFKVLASNDGSTWFELLNKTDANINDETNGGGSSFIPHTINDYYKQFALVVSATRGPRCSVAEIKYFGEQRDSGDSAITRMPIIDTIIGKQYYWDSKNYTIIGNNSHNDATDPQIEWTNVDYSFQTSSNIYTGVSFTLYGYSMKRSVGISSADLSSNGFTLNNSNSVDSEAYNDKELYFFHQNDKIAYCGYDADSVLYEPQSDYDFIGKKLKIIADAEESKVYFYVDNVLKREFTTTHTGKWYICATIFDESTIVFNSDSIIDFDLNHHIDLSDDFNTSDAGITGNNARTIMATITAYESGVASSQHPYKHSNIRPICFYGTGQLAQACYHVHLRYNGDWSDSDDTAGAGYKIQVQGWASNPETTSSVVQEGVRTTIAVSYEEIDGSGVAHLFVKDPETGDWSKETVPHTNPSSGEQAPLDTGSGEGTGFIIGADRRADGIHSKFEGKIHNIKVFNTCINDTETIALAETEEENSCIFKAGGGFVAAFAQLQASQSEKVFWNYSKHGIFEEMLTKNDDYTRESDGGSGSEIVLGQYIGNFSGGNILMGNQSSITIDFIEPGDP